MLKLGQSCPICYRKITKKILNEKYQRKVDNALNTREKMIQNGTNPGPKPKYNRLEIIKLRKMGLSMRKIAANVGCSVSVVQRVIKTQESENK